EMAVARDQFSAQAAGIRSGDFATAQFEGGLATNITQMGLQREQGLLSQLSGVDAQSIQAMGMQGQFLQQNRQLEFEKEKFEHDKTMGFVGAGADVVAGGLGMFSFGGG
ncbi:MAG: hypothetical protein IIA33_07235, partial [Planctomycetes bacterium]|nr:hypothetical protein [Planctomycetota bacterium]